MLLVWIIIIPFIGSIVCWQSQYLNKNMPKWLALFINIILVILSIKIYQQIGFNQKSLLINKIPIWNIEFCTKWINRFNINIHLAIDQLSSLMILLTNVLGIITIIISWNNINKYPGLFYFNIILIITSTIGILLSIDMILFLFFWEFISIPIYFLITIWGNKNIKKRTQNAIIFFIYTQISGIILLCSIIMLSYINYKNTNIWSFDYNTLLKVHMSKIIENILMLGFLISFLIKLPIIPIHKWMINTHISNPINSTVDIIAFLLKIPLYGILRFNISLFHEAINNFSTIISYLLVIGMFYSSFMALAQKNLKKLITYNLIMHTNFALIAICNINKFIYPGIIIYIISNIISTLALFILCKQIYKHLNTFNIEKMGGLWKEKKIFPVITLFFILANIGLPGTGNFIGEIIILLGILKKSLIISILMSLNLLFSSIYSLIILQKIFYGKQKKIIKIQKTNFKILSVNIILIATTLLIGLYPEIILKEIKQKTNNIHYYVENK
ncbi:NADH-quinone oxidoreductase subunit M [Candidatus Purcelliella pentastirinorum]|uniref:NADH-quinone oxidoreductase subunit M n=1 Tax=Candidatus Purcelliella pentastirinorum TaxID=472834 RepID=A0AAX3NA68_9ENTR|nr:NADH-quinone oxidoreductase subunit M [Candidatus Purcelliella pentastirinorum]WDI78365.1 NADH-quinone oxidoreductase subunit M [Candidatus Purcelliella pentastirinorum]WDR80608.1 NADH-quinone oxidoreductase subunit M [Candidatus Purcelliella pentastirinorum]